MTPISQIPEGGIAIAEGLPVLLPGTAIARGFVQVTEGYAAHERHMLRNTILPLTDARIVLVLRGNAHELWRHESEIIPTPEETED